MGLHSDFLPWSDSYSVGDAVIDQHHQMILFFANQFIKKVAMDSFKDKEVLELFDNLKNYTLMHFKFEEDLMNKFCYLTTKDHKTYHQKIVQNILDFEIRFKKGEETAPQEIAEFLKEWIVIHILNEDQNLVKDMKTIAEKGKDKK